MCGQECGLRRGFSCYVPAAIALSKKLPAAASNTKAQVFMLRYAAPRPSNSKLNAAIQAGSTRYDIPIRSRKNLNLATAKLTYG
jgi:hypothetical protein